MAHVELLVNKHPQVLLPRGALHLFSAQPVLLLGISLIEVQHLALGLVEIPKVHTGPSLNPVKVLLDGSPALQHVDLIKHPCVIGKRAEGALNPTILVATKMLKSAGPNTDP